MKNKLALIITLCALINLHAQSSKREEGIKFGLKVGINASNMNGDVDHNSIRNGLHIGFVSEIIIDDKFSLQPELLYSAQGFKSELLDSKERFDYVLLPVLIKYYPISKFSIEAGPQVGFLVNATSRNNSGNTDIKDQNIVDFGVNLGAGYELNSGIFFQGRYNLGITNVNSANNIKYTNSVFQLSVGILF